MALKPGKYSPIKPDIELFDHKSKKRFGLKLDGSGALQIGTISQDDTVHITAAGKKIGDFDEQRSWKGGRGIENLSSNPEGYWDAMNAWSLTDEHIHQTPLWEFSRGLRNSQFSMPSRTKSVQWKQLMGTTRYLAVSFSAIATYSADYARLWVRRVGNPGTLTVEICNDSSGSPGAVGVVTTLTAADFPDVISYLKKFDWSSTASLTNATTYWVKIYGASTDSKTNHWEVGGYDDGVSGGKYSSDNSSWTATTYKIHYFIADADIARTFYSFVLDGLLYVVDRKDDQTTASQLWMAGFRGVASSGTSTTLVTTMSLTTDRWVDAYVKIVRGTGVGQVRQIASNSTTTLTVTVAWNKNPDSTSEFIVYGSRWFTEVSTTGLGVVTGNPLVVNRIVYFPQGATNIRNMIFNATTNAHAFASETSAATLLASTSDAGGTRIWGVGVGAVYASAVAYATSPTTLTWTAVTVGGESYYATGLAEKDGLLYVFKENGVWTIATSNTTSGISVYVTKLSAGIEKTPSTSNGAAVISHQQFIYYSWLHSLIRIYGSSHDDIGQDWSGYGLPDGREGTFSSLDAYTSLLIAGVDARTGTSSVLGWDGLGWHELLRAYDSGVRIRFVKVQPCPETRNKMWVDMGGDLVYQDMPLQKSSPRLDSGLRYQHEAVIESSVIDMGTASGLPKFIKELTVYCENLGDNNEIRVDYQVDDDVHTSNWTEATTLYQAPEAVAFLGLSNIRKFCYRLRIISADNTDPVDVKGVVPNGYARVPFKMVWTLRCRADNITSRGRMVKPDELVRWLLDNARFPGRIEMLSQFELAHKFFVIIHPPRMFPYKPAQNGQAEESVLTLVLEEA